MKKNNPKNIIVILCILGISIASIYLKGFRTTQNAIINDYLKIYRLEEVDDRVSWRFYDKTITLVETDSSYIIFGTKKQVFLHKRYSVATYLPRIRNDSKNIHNEGFTYDSNDNPLIISKESLNQGNREHVLYTFREDDRISYIPDTRQYLYLYFGTDQASEIVIDGEIKPVETTGSIKREVFSAVLDQSPTTLITQSNQVIPILSPIPDISFRACIQSKCIDASYDELRLDELGGLDYYSGVFLRDYDALENDHFITLYTSTNYGSTDALQIQFANHEQWILAYELKNTTKLHDERTGKLEHYIYYSRIPKPIFEKWYAEISKLF